MGFTTRVYDSDGATVLTSKQLVDIFGGVADQPIKFLVENSGDRIGGLAPSNNVNIALAVVGTSDGLSRLNLASEPTTISRPYNFAQSVGGAGGVWGAAQTYGYEMTATNANGETIATAEIAAIVGVVTQKVTLTWTQVTGATGYKIYRTATPGTYGASTLRTTIGSGATVTFVDDGSATTTGTPPAVNTTGGGGLTQVLSGAGAGGVWAATGVYYWRVAALDSAGAILQTTLEATVNVDVSTKKVTLTWSAVSGASTYSVYRSTTTGSYGPTALVTSGLAVLTYDDIGTAVTAGSLTASISYMLPPASGSFGVGALAQGLFPIGKQIPFVIRRVVPSNSAETSNPRQAQIQFVET